MENNSTASIFANLVKSGHYLRVSHGACVPEVPSVQDVLYVLRLADQQESYDFALSNHPIYVANVHIVVAAIYMSGISLDFFQRCLVGHAIFHLIPVQDRCLFNRAVVQALEASTGVRSECWGMNRDSIMKICACSECTRAKSATAPEDVQLPG